VTRSFEAGQRELTYPVDMPSLNSLRHSPAISIRPSLSPMSSIDALQDRESGAFGPICGAGRCRPAHFFEKPEYRLPTLDVVRGLPWGQKLRQLALCLKGGLLVCQGESAGPAARCRWAAPDVIKRLRSELHSPRLEFCRRLSARLTPTNRAPTITHSCHSCLNLSLTRLCSGAMIAAL
jgi:hypothetical protein